MRSRRLSAQLAPSLNKQLVMLGPLILITVPEVFETSHMLRTHLADLDPAALLAQCQVRHLRRGGPGGQRRNKVQTAVQLIHTPTAIITEANERRSQVQNQTEALRRLRLQLALKIRCDVASPTALWQSRVTAGRISINPRHDDFPSMLALALDALAAHDWQPKPAAALLTCSPSQLIKLIKLEPAALHMVNQHRAAASHAPLR